MVFLGLEPLIFGELQGSRFGFRRENSLPYRQLELDRDTVGEVE
jgi:hypothetical protein